MIQLLREELALKMQWFAEVYGDVVASQPATGETLFGTEGRQRWLRLTQDSETFAEELQLNRMASMVQAGPLLTSSWHQGAPYNLLCPDGDGGRTVVGCVATAAAQIVNFWQWPDNGLGTHSYYWSGDNSCDSTQWVGAGQLNADFSDPYDWVTPTSDAALSELNYEMGVAFNMDYGYCGSGTYTGLAVSVFPTYFKYSPDIERKDRIDYSLAEWFDIMRVEIDAGRPAQYRIRSHSIVMDGYRDDYGQLEYHMNYGWNTGHNAWWVLDNLYCGWVVGDVCPWDEEYIIVNIKPQTEPVLTLSACVVDDSNGDNNGRANAGEEISLTVTIVNSGFDAANAAASLSSADVNVSVLSASSSFDSQIQWGQEGITQIPFVVDISPACPDPHNIEFALDITADGDYVNSETFTIFVGNSTGFDDDMESGAGNWSHSPFTPQFADQWHQETYRAHSGAASWKAGGTGSSNYADQHDGALVTPWILLPGNAMLSFWQWLDLEQGSSPGTAWDGAVVMVHSGTEWTQIEPEGGYPYSIIANSASPFEGGAGCFSGQHDWSEAIFDLSSYSGLVKLAFRMGTDGAASEEGWYVDDISVYSAGCCGQYSGGFTGNADCDVDGRRNLSDITKLIDKVYVTKTDLCCAETQFLRRDLCFCLAIRTY
jgi:hypothetical protein